MTTLQEYLNQKYPTKEEKEGVKEINIEKINEEREAQGLTELLEGGVLDLSEFVNVEQVSVNGSHLNSPLTKLILGDKPCLIRLDCPNGKLTSLDIASNCPNLTYLYCSNNLLTSIDFLNSLPNPEKLASLSIFDNNIQPTDIAIFSRFVNVGYLKIGTTWNALKQGKRNQFYGSFKAFQNLTKLRDICIEDTDVNEGLEYLPFSLAKSTKIGKYAVIECSHHYGSNAKCKFIQDQLRPFNYDLEAWQLAHPEKMLIARPELFTNPDSKEKWLKALNIKIPESKEVLFETKEKEADKTKQIIRLESKIQELEQAKATISQQTQTEFSTQDKSTQTELTGEEIAKQQKENQELREQIKKLTLKK